VAADSGRPGIMLPPVCHSAISDVKCHLYDFTTDNEGLAHQVNFLISTIRMSPESTVCKAALHSYICNYFYPGCNTATEQPQGICEDNCVAMFRICGANLIAHLFTVIPPDRDCSNTLEYLYMFGLNFTTTSRASSCKLSRAAGRREKRNGRSKVTLVNEEMGVVRSNSYPCTGHSVSLDQ